MACLEGDWHHFDGVDNGICAQVKFDFLRKEAYRYIGK